MNPPKRQKVEQTTQLSQYDISYAMYIALGYLDKNMCLIISLHKNTFMLNKYIYSNFKANVHITRLLKTAEHIVEENIKVVHFYNIFNTPVRTWVIGYCNIYYHKTEIVSIKPEKNIELVKEVRKVFVPYRNYEIDVIKSINVYYLIKDGITINVSNLLKNTKMVECLGYYRYNVYKHLYENGVCTYNTNNTKEVMNEPMPEGCRVIYIFEYVDEVYNISGIRTPTFKSHNFRCYDLITGSKYYINSHIVNYYENNPDKLNRNALLLIAGILELHHILWFSCVAKIKLSNNSAMYIERENGRYIRTLETD